MSRRYPEPTTDGTARPFRLWNANERRAVRWRCYSDPRRAHMGALYETRWARKVGTTIEVYNVLTGRLLGQYTLTNNSIVFRGEKHGIERAREGNNSGQEKEQRLDQGTQGQVP